MANASPFRRLSADASEDAIVTFDYDGQSVSARAGESVAAALLAAGHLNTRTTPVSGTARGPYCMMGVCFECLLDIDGEPNRQGCMVTVLDGMQVRPMHGARLIGAALDDKGLQ